MGKRSKFIRIGIWIWIGEQSNDHCQRYKRHYKGELDDSGERGMKINITETTESLNSQLLKMKLPTFEGESILQNLATIVECLLGHTAQ